MKIKFLFVDDLYIVLLCIMKLCSGKLYRQNLNFKNSIKSCTRINCIQKHKSKLKKSLTFSGGIRNTSFQNDMARRRCKVKKVTMKRPRIFLTKGSLSLNKNQLYSALGIQDVPIQCSSQRIVVYPLEGEETPPKSIDQFFNERHSFLRSMNIEMLRLETFKQFPTDLDVSAIKLARTGFFYTGSGGSVQCFSCGVKYQEWSMENEDPSVVHRNLSPRCMHVLNQDKTNVPINRNNSIDSDTRTRDIGHASTSNMCASNVKVKTNTNDRISSVNTRSSSHPYLRTQKKRPVQESCASRHGNNNVPSSNTIVSDSCVASIASCHNSHQDEHLNASRLNEEQTEQSIRNEECQVSSDHNNAMVSLVHSLNPAGITSAMPHYPAYEIISERINSFKDWPSNKSQTPIELASAGFFHAGSGDCVRCFYCGGGLKEWEPDDVPWMEHAKWYPRCTFLRRKKGDAFVKRAQEINKYTVCDISSGEEDETIMDSTAVRSVMEMGYTQGKILEALRKNGFRENGDNLGLWAVDILDILMDEEEKQGTSRMASESRNAESFQEKKSAMEEIQRLKHLTLCKVCLDKEVSCVILPCGHLCCCFDCGSILKKCPVCRLVIKKTVRTWLS